MEANISGGARDELRGARGELGRSNNNSASDFGEVSCWFSALSSEPPRMVFFN